MQALIYVRVSSQDQARGWSLETQEAACRTYAAAHGLDVAAVYSDTETGATAERAGYQAMIAAIRRGAASALIIYQNDRLHRNLPNAMLARAELQRLGVEVHSVRRGRAGTTPEEQFVNNIDDLVAELERARTIERTMRGRRAKAESGFFGQGPAPYGYRYVSRDIDKKRQRVLEIDEATAPIVRLIFQWYADEEMGARQIARRLSDDGVRSPGRVNPTQEWNVTRNDWSDPSVYAILRRRAYSGTMELYATRRVDEKKRKVRAKSDRILISVPAIIDEATWERAVQRLATGRQRAKGRRIHEYLLARRIRCACGYAVSGRSSGRIGERLRLWYVCNGRVTRLTARPCSFPLPWLLASRIDSAVWTWIVAHVSDPAELERWFTTRTEAQQSPPPASDIAIRIAKLERGKARLLDLYESEELDRHEWRRRTAALDTEIAGLKAEANATPEPPPPIPIAVARSLLAMIAQVAERLDALTFDERRQLLDALSVVVTCAPAADGAISVRIESLIGSETILI